MPAIRMLRFTWLAGPAQSPMRHDHTRAAAAAAAAAATPGGGGGVEGHPQTSHMRFSLCFGGAEKPAQNTFRTGIQIVEPGSSNHV